LLLYRGMVSGREEWDYLFLWQLNRVKLKSKNYQKNKREWIAESILITQENIDWYIENYVEGTPEYDWNDYWGKWVRGIRE